MKIQFNFKLYTRLGNWVLLLHYMNVLLTAISVDSVLTKSIKHISYEFVLCEEVREVSQAKQKHTMFKNPSTTLNVMSGHLPQYKMDDLKIVNKYGPKPVTFTLSKTPIYRYIYIFKTPFFFICVKFS